MSVTTSFVFVNLIIIIRSNYYCMYIPLISISEEEVKTLVGQLTTLDVTIGDSVPGTKNGEPIDHLMVQSQIPLMMMEREIQ